MRMWYFFGLLLVGLLLVGLVSADSASDDKGLWDIVVDFFVNVFSAFTGQAIVGVVPIPVTGEWWNSSWHYRIAVEVDMNGFNRTDWPVEVGVNFSSELEGVGDLMDFDLNSIRVIEYNSSGYVLWEVKSDFEEGAGFDVSGNAVGDVVFILNGTTDSGSVRDFLIYFDSVDRVKVDPGYSSLINYNFDGSEFSFQNSLLDFGVDTSRGELTSGIYFAERTDSSKVIFDVGSSERTVEYLRYSDGSNYYGVDLDGDATLEFDGAVKKVVYQEGSEVDWGTVGSTGNEIWRRYTVYDRLPWIFVEHGIKNLGGASISRQSDGVGVPAIDVDRAFGLDNLIGPGGAAADPFSWKSATKTSGAFGVGIINFEEVGTTNYYVQGSVFSGQIGVQLAATTIDVGDEISSKAVVHFNDEDNHDVVQDLKDRLGSPAVLSLGSSEEYVIDLNLSSEFNIYNLNESVFVELEVLTDSHDLVRFVNVTFDMGTGSVADDVVLELLENSSGVYDGRYTVEVAADVGTWGIDVEVYDKYLQEIGSVSSGFNVSDRLNGDLVVLNPAGLAGRDVFAVFSLDNVRNDSGISASVSCSYNGTPVFDILEVSLGNYSVNFSAPGVIGTYELNCSGLSSGNSDWDVDLFYVEPDKTTINFSFVPLNQTVSGVTQVDAANFSVDVFMENVGGGFSAGVNVTLVMPNGDFVVNSSGEECFGLLPGDNCSKVFFIDVLSGAVPGNYSVLVNVSWIDPDLSLNYSVGTLDVDLESNAIFNLSGFIFSEDVGEGENKSYANFSVDSIGNDDVLDVVFSCASGVVCSDFSVDMVPLNFSSISGGSSGSVEVFVGVPEGYASGNYGGIIGVGSLNAGIRSFGFNVSVAESGTWDVSRVSCYDVVLVEAAGDICEVVVNNSGNVELNFSVLPSGGNYTYVDPQNFSLPEQANGSFYVRYNTTGAPPNENFVLEYVLNVVSGEPVFRTLNISLDVVFGPEVWIALPVDSEQGGNFLIEANISDRSFSGIDWVLANVTRPLGGVDVVNLSNVSAIGVGGYSLWEASYSNTLERGTYEILVYSRDLSGGTGENNDSLITFARLNVSLESGWEDYLLGESGTIYYSVEDYSGLGLVADVNISIRDSDGNVRYDEFFLTNSLGRLDVLPSFSIPDDAVVGEYNLSAQTGYSDVISGRRIGGFSEELFDVYDHLFVSLDTSVTWYPDSVMAFYLLVYSTGFLSAFPSEVDLFVFDPAQAEYLSATLGDFTVISNDSNSILYLYKYAMPANSPTGDFLATVSVKEGTRSFQDVQSFRVSSGGPFDLILNLSVVDAVRGGVVPFEVIMKNMGEVPQDVYLDYWVSDVAGNNYSKVTGEAIFVDAMGETTISRTLPIFDWQSLGEHLVYVTMDYSAVVGPITTSKNFFVVEGNESEPEVEVPASSGGGGGSDVTAEVILEEEEALVILDIDPDELEIERGGISYLMLEMKNNLDWDLVGVEAELIVEGEKIGSSGVLDLLPMGEKVVLPVKVAVDKDYVSGFYSGILRVYSGGVSSDVVYRVSVFDSKEELLEYRKSRLENRLDNLRARTVVADNEGFEVKVIFDSIQRTSLDFYLFDDRLKARKYLESVEYLERIENDIETLEYELDGIINQDRFGWLVWVLIAGIIVLLVLIIGVLVSRGRKVLDRMHFEILRRKYRKKVGKKRRRRVEKIVAAAVGGDDADYLKTLKEQYHYGYISKAAYEEARGRR